MARSPRINIKLSDWALERVQKLADADDRSISSYCQRVIEGHVGGGAWDFAVGTGAVEESKPKTVKKSRSKK